MNAHERKVELFKKKVTLAQIAREISVSQSHVSLVIAGRSISARVQAAIAEKIGLPVDEVFPPPAREGAAA